MPNCDFDKVANELRHGCSLVICGIFSEHLFIRTLLDAACVVCR